MGAFERKDWSPILDNTKWVSREPSGWVPKLNERSQGRRAFPDLGSHTEAQLNKMHWQTPELEVQCGWTLATSVTNGRLCHHLGTRGDGNDSL